MPKRTVTVKRVEKGDTFTKDQVANLLGIAPQRINRWWTSPVRDGSKEYYLKATIT